jgi:DNA-binding MarR family transcriptional regulator
MTNKELVIDKIEKIMSLVVPEIDTPWDYGEGFPLFYAEIQLIMVIQANDGANASTLASVMKVTGGAVSQIAGKLLKKGFIESYRLPDNRKEVFFRLTESGKKVFRAHKKHMNKTGIAFMGFIDGLNQRELQKICDFLDIWGQSVADFYKPVRKP